jgi:uncharacterized protein
MHSLIFAGALATLVAGPAIPAHSAEITDDAGFFSRKALDKANSELASLRREYGKDVRIESFDVVPGGKIDEVAKMDRTERGRFFDKWARDRATAERVKGIYILICKHPGHVQIEIDRQTRNQGFGDSERDHVREILLGGFKHKDYDKSLLDSVEFIRDTMKKKLRPQAEAIGSPAAPHQRVDQYDREAGNRQPARGMGWLGWIIVALAVFLGIRLIMALFTAFSGGGRPGGYGGGYGPGYGGGGGGGGMMSSIMGGLFGAVAGNWLYNSFLGPTAHAGQSGDIGAGATGERNVDSGAGEDFQGSGGDFDDRGDASGGGDFGSGDGGGDFGEGGGGDFGGGDFGGGDFGGGDSGGGDF